MAFTEGFLALSAGELQPCDQSCAVSAFGTLPGGFIRVLTLDTTGCILGAATVQSGSYQEQNERQMSRQSLEAGEARWLSLWSNQSAPRSWTKDAFSR